MSKWSRALLSYVTSPICPYFCNLEKGSSSCKMRPACTDKDYFYTHTACDANGEVGSTVWEPLCPQIAPLPAPWALLPHLEFQRSVELVPEKTPQTSAVTPGPEGGGGQDEVASFIFRSETGFATFVLLLIHICSVAKSHCVFFCLVSSIHLAPLGHDCLSMHTHFLMELIRPVPSALLLSAGKGNSFLPPGSLENGLAARSLLVPSFSQAFCLRKTFLCSLPHL